MSENISLDIDRYAMANKIGEGGFSKVYRVKDLKTNKFYAAKIANIMIDEETQNSEEARLLFREVNLMSLFNHPSILKFIGYYPTNFEGDPLPTIITELASNGSLRDIIEMEQSGLSPNEWGDTKKLINIYGIASGMSYLHEHNIQHRDLKPENVLIDSYLYPKISDFGLSKITDFLSMSMNFQSQKGLKGTPIYMAPEILSNEEYSKSGDVYAFAFIVFEMITGERPFKEDKITMLQLIKKVLIEGYRPIIGGHVPDSYRKLIEDCWSERAKDRPSFDDIVERLKNDEGFITEMTDTSEFYDYIDFIDSYKTTFNKNERILVFNDFIKNKGRKKTVEAVSIKNNVKFTENKDSALNDSTIQNYSNANIQTMEETVQSGSKEEILYPRSEFDTLKKACQELVREAISDSSKQFLVGRSLIEGLNDFPVNIDLGLKYIEESVKCKCIDSMIYLSRMLIQGDIVNKNLERAREILSKINPSQDKCVFFLRGQISLMKNKYSESAKYFLEGSKAGDVESMFEYGKMLFIGEGVKQNLKESLKYIEKTKDEGYKKGEYFLKAYEDLKQIKNFTNFPPETQLFFITNNVDNLINNNNDKGMKERECEFNKIYFPPMNTEKMYFNKTLKSPIFIESINAYKQINIEIEFPSPSFKSINELLIKIQDQKNKSINIGVVITSFQTKITRECFSKSFSYCRIVKIIDNIPQNAFEGCSSLRQISIPSSITSIGDYAFDGCSSLTEIIIPSFVTSIGDYAFYGCSSLREVTIPSFVTSIRYSAFYGCSSLTKITISSSVTSIGDYSFRGCSSLEQITIPSSVSSIGKYAFYECSSLIEITIPSSVTSIGDYAFKGCSSLVKATIPSSITSIGKCAFKKCSSLTGVTIPSSVTSIGDYAFRGCSSLTEIMIPSSVTSIGKCAFSRCSSLVEITIPSSVISIGDYAFKRCSLLAKATIPSSITSNMYTAFCRCSSLTQVTIPSSVTSIGNCAFCECSSLTEITIPSSVTSIESSAFEGCSSLKEITIPFSVTSIGDSAFERCSSLKQIAIPDSVTSIGWIAFSGCSSLTEITIPSFVTSIGNYAFEDCSSLTEITISSSVTSIGKDAFRGCSSLKQIMCSLKLNKSQIGVSENTQIKTI